MPELSIQKIQKRIEQLNDILEGMKNAKPSIRKPLEDVRNAMLVKQNEILGSATELTEKKPKGFNRPQLNPGKKRKKKKRKKAKQSQPQPKKPKKPAKPNKSKKDYYQAVGEIVCKVSREGDDITASVNGDNYPVFPQTHHGKVWESFLEQTFPTKLLLKVHPISFGGRCQILSLWGFAEITPDNAKTNKFKMRGLYNSARPGKVTIPRNPKSRKKLRKIDDENKLIKSLKPKTHRVNWDKPSVPPWKKGEDKPSLYFVDLACKLTRGGGFKVVEEVKPPKTELPDVLRRKAIAPQPPPGNQQTISETD
jgi:hypothetical protein